MELKTPPQCQCGNGFMLLRTAGNYSTRPGHQYYVCPMGQKHRRSFFWYDEYDSTNVTSTDDRSYNTDNNSATFQQQSCCSTSRMRCTSNTMNSSSSPHHFPSKCGPAYNNSKYGEFDGDMCCAT